MRSAESGKQWQNDMSALDALWTTEDGQEYNHNSSKICTDNTIRNEHFLELQDKSFLLTCLHPGMVFWLVCPRW